MNTTNKQLQRLWHTRLGTFLLVCLLLTACSQLSLINTKETQRNMIDPDRIYWAFTTEQLSQIWSLSLKDSTILQIYAVPSLAPINSLDDRELVFLDALCSSLLEKCNIEDLRVAHSIYDVSLSPDKQYLSWLESASACVDAACFGHTNLFVWKTDGKSEPQILLSQPYHADILDRLSFDSYLWSPNSKNIGYIVSSQLHGWARIRVVEVQTKALLDIGDTSGKQFEWSPTDNWIAYISSVETDTRTISIVSVDNKSRLTYTNQWSDIANFAWSPDGSWIIVNGKSINLQDKSGTFDLYRLKFLSERIEGKQEPFVEDIYCNSISWSPVGNWVACSNFEHGFDAKKKIFIVDMSNGNILEINRPDSQLSNPQWSPDGMVLALNVSSNDSNTADTLMIFDPNTTQFIAALDDKDISNVWTWGPASENILVLFGNPSKPCIQTRQGIGLYNWRNAMFRELALGSLVENEIEKCGLHIDDIDW